MSLSFSLQKAEIPISNPSEQMHATFHLRGPPCWGWEALTPWAWLSSIDSGTTDGGECGLAPLRLPGHLPEPRECGLREPLLQTWCWWVLCTLLRKDSACAKSWPPVGSQSVWRQPLLHLQALSPTNPPAPGPASPRVPCSTGNPVQQFMHLCGYGCVRPLAGQCRSRSRRPRALRAWKQ